MEGNKQKTEISEIDIAALFYKLYLNRKKIYKAIASNGIFKGRISNFLFGYRDACNGWHGTGRHNP